jgi:hypothetical protein
MLPSSKPCLGNWSAIARNSTCVGTQAFTMASPQIVGRPRLSERQSKRVQDPNARRDHTCHEHSEIDKLENIELAFRP